MWNYSSNTKLIFDKVICVKYFDGIEELLETELNRILIEKKLQKFEKIN